MSNNFKVVQDRAILTMADNSKLYMICRIWSIERCYF